jgi:hypothetical protein
MQHVAEDDGGHDAGALKVWRKRHPRLLARGTIHERRWKHDYLGKTTRSSWPSMLDQLERRKPRRAES